MQVVLPIRTRVRGLTEISKLIRDSGVNAVKATLGGAIGNFEMAVADIASAQQLMEKRADLFLNVRTPADLDRARKEQKLGVIYSFESPNMLEDKIDRIELFRGLGVRVMQLTYNRRTPFGVGCLDGETDGITDLGRKAIAKMNELGVALDLSHSNTKTTADGIAASTKPPLITHAGCRAVYMHPRNKEDRELKALADKGGVVGIYMLPYITASPKQPIAFDTPPVSRRAGRGEGLRNNNSAATAEPNGLIVDHHLYRMLGLPPC